MSDAVSCRQEISTDILFEEFNTIASAPGGVAKLRELILSLAVQGKLVPQNPADEPASVLLERIAAEKKRLVKEGKIKKAKPLPPVRGEEVPYAVPEGWEWTRLEEIGLINPRNDEYATNLEASFIPMQLISEKYGVPPSSENRKWGEIQKGFTHFSDNDVVLAKITPCFQNGKSAVMKGLINGIGAGTTELHVFRSISDFTYPHYVQIYLKSPKFLNEGISKMTGSAGQKRVPKEYFSRNPFPLPPLAEQHRIVEKVDALMKLCDALEAQQAQQQEVRTKLGIAALAALSEAEDAAAFDTAWSRICDEFDLIFDTPENVAALRQAVLQLAVQGRLVPQDPTDEPASVLLERIAAEKKRLVRGGKIKSAKSLPFGEDAKPYAVPEGWEWVQLNRICTHVTDGDHLPPPQSDEGVPFVVISNIRKGCLDFSNTRFVPREYFKKIPEQRKPRNGDVLYSVTGSYGIPVLVGSDEEFCFQRHIALLRPDERIFSPYILNVMRSPLIYDQAKHAITGIAQPTVSLSALRSFILPLPPLAEQHRIVEKVDALMVLCDDLETQIRKRREVQTGLLESVITGLTAQG